MSWASVLPAAMKDVQQQQRGQQAVAGGAAAGEDDVAGLFSAQRRAGGQHLFEDILVADGRAQHFDPGALQCGFQAHVGHGRRDDGGVGEQAACGEVAGREQQDGVAVDDLAVLIGKEGAVGVAVEGNSHGGVLLRRPRRRRSWDRARRSSR